MSERLENIVKNFDKNPLCMECNASMAAVEIPGTHIGRNATLPMLKCTKCEAVVATWDHEDHYTSKIQKL